MNATAVPSNASNTTASTNTTTTSSKKAKTAPKGTVVKINLTAEITVLDLAATPEAKRMLSIEK